jgi:nucleotide-binding universal stress UspA family protein
MKTILVPTDLSATSTEAIQFANKIATDGSGSITLFHSFDLPAVSGLGKSFEQNYVKQMKDNVHASMEKLAGKWITKGVKTNLLTTFGGFIPSLKKAAADTGADVIVMGTKGASGLREYTVGSNAEKVVRTSDIPVICVRKSTDSIKNIVFPTSPDFSQEKITMRVKALQEFFGAKVHVLFVNTPASFKRDVETRPALEKFAKRFMFKNFTLNTYSDTTEAEGIINFSNSINAGLVAMRTHGRTGLAHIATDSIAEDVLNHIKCPIWTLKIK